MWMIFGTKLLVHVDFMRLRFCLSYRVILGFVNFEGPKRLLCLRLPIKLLCLRLYTL